MASAADLALPEWDDAGNPTGLSSQNQVPSMKRLPITQSLEVGLPAVDSRSNVVSSEVIRSSMTSLDAILSDPSADVYLPEVGAVGSRQSRVGRAAADFFFSLPDLSSVRDATDAASVNSVRTAAVLPAAATALPPALVRTTSAGAPASVAASAVAGPLQLLEPAASAQLAAGFDAALGTLRRVHDTAAALLAQETAARPSMRPPSAVATVAAPPATGISTGTVLWSPDRVIQAVDSPRAAAPAGVRSSASDAVPARAINADRVHRVFQSSSDNTHQRRPPRALPPSARGPRHDTAVGSVTHGVPGDYANVAPTSVFDPDLRSSSSTEALRGYFDRTLSHE
jgi:hypothetical protein